MTVGQSAAHAHGILNLLHTGDPVNKRVTGEEN